MTTAKTQTGTPTQTGPLPALGDFAFRDGVWYLTPAKPQPKG